MMSTLCQILQLSFFFLVFFLSVDIGCRGNDSFKFQCDANKGKCAFNSLGGSRDHAGQKGTARPGVQMERSPIRERKNNAQI